ncbi:MAG: Stk1 family PASTA domain-containing Ser/Thr kinase [Clostridiales Family XIII bacterium]|jgi:serine/threonine-protein kinase|nr:Stk1 family PASTA domain-containing Ser/Thr kinase [Clostridiales Family XIII bacterium]
MGGNLVLAGRYEILEKIGDGGMAVVYKARDKLLSRFVAVKVLKKEFVKDTTFVENFRKESKAAASLLHPNIVNIYDVGKDRDVYYIVMEYVEGRTLSDLIAAEAPLDYKRSISIAKQMASALSLAHRNNIIHRDVKPHNILITTDGTAKITDFGIAKAVSDGTILSENGIIMGSVHYFSPEQSRGQYVDEKSDIYSLGIVLYEMLTGRVPFDADNPVTIAVMHMNDTIIPPSRLVKGVPPGLDQIVLKATAKFQSDRFRNIDEMYKALDNINFITGIIDDPEIAGFVAPTNLHEETPGRGSSSAAVDSHDENFDDAGKGGGYDEEADDGEYDDEDERPGFFAGLFGGGKSAQASAKENGSGSGKKAGAGKKGRKKMDTKYKVLAIAAAIVIALLLMFPLSKLLSGLFSDKLVEVIDVVGMDVSDATALLEKDGFKVDATEVDNKGHVPKKDDDKTAAGASGASGAEAAGASGASGAGGSDPVIIEYYAENEVLSQDPKAGSKAKEGATVKLKFAGPPQSAEQEEPFAGVVIDLLGKTKASAEYAITANGFTLGGVTYADSDMPVDQVIDQTPKAGEQAAKDSPIYLVISQGPKIKTTTVPNLAGMTLEAARGIVDEKKLTLGSPGEEYSNDYPKDTIMWQDIAANSPINEGQVVNVTVSLGKPEVPGFDGFDDTAYTAQLKSVTLLRGSVTSEYHATIPAGNVISVMPAVGTPVKVGSTVSFVVSKGPEPAPPTPVTPPTPPADGGAGAG